MVLGDASTFLYIFCESKALDVIFLKNRLFLNPIGTKIVTQKKDLKW
jgi:hypothetical protein